MIHEIKFYEYINVKSLNYIFLGVDKKEVGQQMPRSILNNSFALIKHSDFPCPYHNLKMKGPLFPWYLHPVDKGFT
jgi:hypothetical protein